MIHEGSAAGATQYGGAGNCRAEGISGCGTVFAIKPHRPTKARAAKSAS